MRLQRIAFRDNGFEHRLRRRSHLTGTHQRARSHHVREQPSEDARRHPVHAQASVAQRRTGISEDHGQQWSQCRRRSFRRTTVCHGRSDVDHRRRRTRGPTPKPRRIGTPRRFAHSPRRVRHVPTWRQQRHHAPERLQLSRSHVDRVHRRHRCLRAACVGRHRQGGAKRDRLSVSRTVRHRGTSSRHGACRGLLGVRLRTLAERPHLGHLVTTLQRRPVRKHGKRHPSRHARSSHRAWDRLGTVRFDEPAS